MVSKRLKLVHSVIFFWLNLFFVKEMQHTKGLLNFLWNVTVLYIGTLQKKKK